MRWIILLIVIVGAIGALIYSMGALDPVPEDLRAVEHDETLTCTDGTVVRTQFLADDNVIVTLDGVSHALEPAVSASGARYANADGSFVFWNTGDESMILVNDEVAHQGCRTAEAPDASDRPEAGDAAEAPQQRASTDPIVNGHAIAFVLPEGAEFTADDDTRYRVQHVGPQNEPPALTDGYAVTMTLLVKDSEISLEAFVDAQLPNIFGAEDAEPEQASFFGHESNRFSHETALGNTTATEHFVLVDAATVARITVSAIGTEAQQYRAPINELLASITFEYTGTASEVADRIQLTTPQPNDEITSPLVLEGEARGMWYFEADFPVILTDWDGRTIAEHYAVAEDAWMTEDFVPFSAELEFESPYTPGDPDFMRNGWLILQRANPSGLPEHDATLEIPVRFGP